MGSEEGAHDMDLKMSELSNNPRISNSRLATTYLPADKTNNYQSNRKIDSRMELSELNYSQDMLNSNSRNALTNYLTPLS